MNFLQFSSPTCSATLTFYDFVTIFYDFVFIKKIVHLLPARVGHVFYMYLGDTGSFFLFRIHHLGI